MARRPPEAPLGAIEALVERFVAGRISATEFERRYLEAFKHAARIEPEAVFLALDALFADVDAYCGDPTLRRSGDLDEAQLLERARQALARIARVRGPR